MNLIDEMERRIRVDGGFTFDAYSGSFHTQSDGYFVSSEEHERLVNITLFDVELLRYLIAHGGALEYNYAVYLGAWKPYETSDEVELTITSWYPDLGQAMRVAREQNQRAIYDCAAQTVIKIPLEVEA
jgi:hypothetical protein